MRSLFLAVLFAAAGPIMAAAAERTSALADLVRIGDLIAVMQKEGLRYGEDVATEFFPGRIPSGWMQTVGTIYDADRMEAEVRAAFNAEMGEVDLRELEAFYRSDLGQEVVSLEISVREAFLEVAVEEAATEEMRLKEQENDARLAWVKEFSARNDLVDENVVGAMNSNFAFYQGLASDLDAFPMSEDEMLRDVWSQEPDIRASTEEWLYSYLFAAYGPLEEDQLDAYMDMTQTEEGRAMTRALFAAFDVSFVRISRELGAAAARYLGSQEL